MASLKKSNLSKVKKQLLNKNIKTGGPLKFNPDASNKIFQLCKTGKKTFLLLSFQNNPVEYQRYLRADLTMLFTHREFSHPQLLRKILLTSIC